MRTINDNRVQYETHTHPIIVTINSHSKPIKILWNSYEIPWNLWNSSLKSYEIPMKWWWNLDLRYSTIMASMAVASTCGASPWPPLLARTLGKSWGNGLKNTVWNMLGEMDWNHLKPENVEKIWKNHIFPGCSRNLSRQLCQLSPNFVVLAHHETPPAATSCAVLLPGCDGDGVAVLLLRAGAVLMGKSYGMMAIIKGHTL